MTWRYHAQNLITGQWLHRDLPLSDVQMTWQLSGAGSLEAKVTPDIRSVKDAFGNPILEEWSTAIYAEEGNEIRHGSILITSDFQGPSWSLVTGGFCGYVKGMPYDGSYSQTNYDPTDVVRDLWNWAQAQPDGNLGMVVDSTTSTVLIGATKDDQGVLQPYKIDWWDNKDIGSEIDNLAKSTPFDYYEEHAWTDNVAKSAVTHKLRLGFPRLGARQLGLRFAEGENISDLVMVKKTGDKFANQVIATGAGSGSTLLRSTAGSRDNHLRRVVVVQDQSLTDQGVLDSLAQDEAESRKNMVEIIGCTVRNHPNAVIGSFNVGDDILVQANVGWNQVQVWSRITSYTVTPEDPNYVQLTMLRSDRFRYVGGLSGGGTGGG